MEQDSFRNVRLSLAEVGIIIAACAVVVAAYTRHEVKIAQLNESVTYLVDLAIEPLRHDGQVYHQDWPYGREPARE